MTHCQGLSPVNHLHIIFFYVHACISRLVRTPWQIDSKISLSSFKMKLSQKLSLESEREADFHTTPYLIMHSIITLFTTGAPKLLLSVPFFYSPIYIADFVWLIVRDFPLLTAYISCSFMFMRTLAGLIWIPCQIDNKISLSFLKLNYRTGHGCLKFNSICFLSLFFHTHCLKIRFRTHRYAIDSFDFGFSREIYRGNYHLGNEFFL